MTITTTGTETAAHQRTAPLVIVSCDTHIGPRLQDDLRPYCPEDLLEEFDAYAAALQANREKAAAAKKRVSFGDTKMGDDWGVRLDNLQTPGHFNMHAYAGREYERRITGFLDWYLRERNIAH